MIGINPAIFTSETKPNLAKIPKSVIASAAWQSRKKNCHCEGGWDSFAMLGTGLAIL
jgi:hypothetical protein